MRTWTALRALTASSPFFLSAWGCRGTEGVLVRTRNMAGDASVPDDGSVNARTPDGGSADAEASDGGQGDAGRPSDLWQPARDASFQLQLQGRLDTSVDADFYVIDVDVSDADLTRMRAQGRPFVCHFSAGSVETFRDDAANIPESARGNPLPDYPNERWLDVRDEGVRSTMRARIARARERGCSAILPTNLTVHLFDAGFVISEAELLAYARWLTREARKEGLSAMLGSEQVAGQLTNDFHMGLAFECLRADGCALWAPFVADAKPVFAVEVGGATDAQQVCEKAREVGLPVIIKNRNFDAFRVACP